MKTIADRLKEAREERGLTQPQLADLAGVSAGTIGNVESGARKRPRDLLAIADALGVNPAWLQNNIGPKYKDSAESAPPHMGGKMPLIQRTTAELSRYSDSQNFAHPTTLVPVESSFQGLDMSQKNSGLDRYSWHWLTVPGVMSDFTKIVIMPDDSMQPEIYPGEYIAFDPEIEADSGDTVLVVDAENILRVRKYRPRTEGRFDAVAINPEYATLNSVGDRVHVVAVLVGHWRGRRAKRH